VIARVDGGRVRSVNSLGVFHQPGSSPVECCGVGFDSRPWPLCLFARRVRKVKIHHV